MYLFFKKKKKKMSFVVVLFSVVHKWYSILFNIAELQFTVIIYGYLIPREKLQKFSRDKTICTKYNSTFSIFQNSNMKENLNMVWFTNLVMTHDHRRGFPFFSKVENFLSIVQHVLHLVYILFTYEKIIIFIL